MYSIRTLVERLKPRTGKSSTEERINAIICFSLVCCQKMKYIYVQVFIHIVLITEYRGGHAKK